MGQAADTPREPSSNGGIGPASGTGPRAYNGAGEGAPSDHQGRREFTQKIDLPLMKDVRAVGAHIAGWGQSTALFEELSLNLNASKKFPWVRTEALC